MTDRFRETIRKGISVKAKVLPMGSEILQKAAFAEGYSWAGADDKRFTVQDVTFKYLFFLIEDGVKKICRSNMASSFLNDISREYIFENDSFVIVGSSTEEALELKRIFDEKTFDELLKIHSSPRRKEVDDFSQMMEYVLRMHDQKSHWSTCLTHYLLLKMKKNAVKLEESLINADQKQIMKDCVDIANYAMMIFDKVRKSKIVSFETKV